MDKAQYKANRKYQKNNTKSYGVMFNKKYDAEIIQKLDSVPNKTEYIRSLIKADLEK